MSDQMVPAEILAWRKLLGITQGDAARELGISLTQYNNYERGRAAIPAKIRLATQALAMRAGELKPKRDGRFRKPYDWVAEQGKPLYVYYANGVECGYVPEICGKDPSGRQRAKSEEQIRAMPEFGARILRRIEEHDDSWHIYFG